MADIADFRSDTMTRPHERMRQAMAQAVVGDDVWGEDPTVKELEARAAEFLGQEAALFVPSGTMANQVAVHVHCRPGDELICEQRSHVFLFEGGSAARLSGTQVRTFASDSGFPEPADVEALVRGDDAHYPRSRLLVIENTHNMAGGRVLPRAGMQKLLDLARRHGLAVHVDGARVVNAAVASGCSPAELVAGTDSVSLCFSKGLGAPVGSVIAGSKEFVAGAHRARKAFGGGMRQVGILAAAALIALEEGPGLVAEDHRRAQRLAVALRDLPGLSVGPVDSNILMLDVATGSAEDLLRYLEPLGVRAMAVGPARLRFTLHRDVSDAHVERGIRAVTDWTEEQAR
ncbi:MAG: threonine aldolase family protein [Planctomycetota bacterium]